MDLLTIGLIVLGAWTTLIIVAVALCSMASRADAANERLDQRRRTPNQ